MTLNEFKAWFEGYTEGLEGAPTAAQFARIKEKVKAIDGTPVTQTIFLDSYRRFYPYYDYLRPYWTSGGTAVGIGTAVSGNDLKAAYASNASFAGKGDSVTETFDSPSAMYALGKAEAMN